MKECLVSFSLLTFLNDKEWKELRFYKNEEQPN